MADPGAKRTVFTSNDNFVRERAVTTTLSERQNQAVRKGGKEPSDLLKWANTPTHLDAVHANQVDRHIDKPIPPQALQGLRTGPELSVEYESPHAEAIDGSKSLLRNLSPFVFRVEPPLVFGSDAAFVGAWPSAIKQKKASVGIYGAARRGTGGFSSARGSLGNASFTNIGTTGGSVEEYVAANAAGRVANASGDGSVKVGPSGEAPTRLGKPAIADLYAAVDIATQLQSVIHTPPLALLINPETMAIAFSKIQQFQDRSRHGYIFQAWGQEQPKMSISARCGAFISGSRGVQFASRRDSASWQNLTNALHFYRHNGYIYDTIGKSNAHHFVGALSIHYDQWIYYGNMETFAYTLEDTNQLGGIQFQMDFTISMMVDTASSPLNVLPMSSPTPDPFDSRFTGIANRARNRPGEFSVGLNSDGSPRLSTQGRAVSQADAFTPLSGLDIFNPPVLNGRQEGFTTQPIGQSFQAPSSTTGPGERAVNQAQPDRVEPFRVGS